MFTPNVGDTVRVSKSVLGEHYHAEGAIEQMQRDRTYGCYIALVSSDWWLLTNDAENHFEIIQPPNAVCRLCGQSGVEMVPFDDVQNYDEDGRPDDGGCFVEHVTRWQCADRDACRQVRREQGALVETLCRFRDQEWAEEGRAGIGRGGVG